MAYIGAPLVSTNFVLDQFTATASQTAFTMSRAPASAQSVLVGIDGVVQEPSSAYTISGTTLTMTSGVPLSSRVWIVHLGVQGVLTTPADGSVTYAKLATDAKPVLMTPVTLSGTSVDFTSIPTGTKQIVVAVSGMSVSSTSPVTLQIGDAGGIETSGYVGTSWSASPSGSDLSSGFAVQNAVAASTLHGAWTLTLINSSTNLWACTMAMSFPGSGNWCSTSGSKALSQELDRVRMTTNGGTDTFDGGSANILYFR